MENKWISVREQRPEPNVKLLWVGDKQFRRQCDVCRPRANHTRFGYLWNKPTRGYRFHDITSGLDLEVGRVTHWMELPAAPAEEGGEEK